MVNKEIPTFQNIGAITEYPSTIVLDLTAHIFFKNEECAE